MLDAPAIMAQAPPAPVPEMGADYDDDGLLATMLGSDTK
jgi:hypothetical protein